MTQHFPLSALLGQVMSPRGHVVALTIASWGHAKATCTLLTKITRKEISNNFVPGSEDDLKELIRVVGIESETLPLDFTQLTTNFLDGYRKLCASQTVQTTPTSDGYHSAIPPPQLVIMDFFAYDAFQGVRQETGTAVPIYALESTSASAVLFLWGPEKLGGNGDLSKKLEAITEMEEKAAEAEADKIYRRVKGELLMIPGLPPMYDHEFSPQEVKLSLYYE
ncbi:UDP-Glycosyltransferase/glycogen phosphorylase [Sanghuangporus baumii]|uniref:UDP-Glycosyltransferase/glycogen phosphorylase n=1 Tax=Sanghuangporus baumii TaxID=108892 RepID=A0A9Q5NFB4_SANBA|nr:UDP-Glycosyltransferase/glycogen phosphorylase [Sanghuangporus baumii]